MSTWSHAANDVGRSAQKVKRIQLAFQQAYETLQKYELTPGRNNIMESIIGLSDEVCGLVAAYRRLLMTPQTLTHRSTVRRLVLSGALESSLTTVGLPFHSQNTSGGQYRPAQQPSRGYSYRSQQYPRAGPSNYASAAYQRGRPGDYSRGIPLALRLSPPDTHSLYDPYASEDYGSSSRTLGNHTIDRQSKRRRT